MNGFFKLPLPFEVAPLQRELTQWTEADWQQSPAINDQATLVLLAVGGTLNHDFAIAGPLAPTAFLLRCPYLQHLLSTFKNPLARSWLVRLKGTSQIPLTTYHYYHWLRRVPIYLPIVVPSSLQIFNHDHRITAKVGEAWTLDHWQPHGLINESELECVYLVVETRKTTHFAGLSSQNQSITLHEISDLAGHQNHIPLESYGFEVLTSEDIEMLITKILLTLENSELTADKLSTFNQAIQTFKQQWQLTFERFGHRAQGELAYQTLIFDFRNQVVTKVPRWLTGEGKAALEVIDSMLLTSDHPIAKQRNRKTLTLAKTKQQIKSQLAGGFAENLQCPKFEKPLFIVSAPRAGSTLLFETLSQFTELWTIAEESHEVIEGIPEFHPSAKAFHSNRLTAEDTTPTLSALLRERFVQQLQDIHGQIYLKIPPEQRPTKIRFLEKTPKNALRIPFLRAVFPQALFIYLYRDPYENISSLVEGWRSRRFIAYHALPAWPHRAWSFLLPPEWRTLQDCSLIEIATYQWKMANTYILDDLRNLPPTTWCMIHYTDFIREPQKTLKVLSEFAELQWHQAVEQLTSRSLPVSQLTLSAPSPDKWRKYEQPIAALWSTLEPVVQSVNQIKGLIR